MIVVRVTCQRLKEYRFFHFPGVFIFNTRRWRRKSAMIFSRSSSGKCWSKHPIKKNLHRINKYERNDWQICSYLLSFLLRESINDYSRINFSSDTRWKINSFPFSLRHSANEFILHRLDVAICWREIRIQIKIDSFQDPIIKKRRENLLMISICWEIEKKRWMVHRQILNDFVWMKVESEITMENYLSSSN